MKLGTSGRWVGTQTGAAVTATTSIKLSWSQPMAPWISATAYECAAAQSMDPWVATKKALHYTVSINTYNLPFNKINQIRHNKITPNKNNNKLVVKLYKID